MNYSVNSEIATTQIITRKKQTLIAALGVMIGIAIFIFLNSLMIGFDRSAITALFKTVPHIRLYKDDEISKPLAPTLNGTTPLIVNPKIVPRSKTIINPFEIITLLKQQNEVSCVTAQVKVTVFYNNGKTQLNGIASGIVPKDENGMFNTQSFMVEGSIIDLEQTVNGIILGTGVAAKMNVRTGDNISITSSKEIQKIMKVVGLFQTNNATVDKTKSYINRNFAQQLLKENSAYITDVFININNSENAKLIAPKLAQLTGYTAEDWESANAQVMAANNMRKMMARAISFAILLVAAFGIYNILNMTIMEKMNDIAILKAIGFKGKDIVVIFVQQAVIIGIVGLGLGLAFANILIKLMSKVYIGGDIGFFPIDYEPSMFALGSLFAITVTFLAGYIPAKKAAKIDPVSILRK